MRRIGAFVLLVCAAYIGSGASAFADDAILNASMNGANEVLGGDPDGTGTATVWTDDENNNLCIWVTVRNIVLPSSGFHIHFAPAGLNGPVVVPFATFSGRSTFQCVSVPNEDLLDNIGAHPEQYYVNVHNSVYPGGAIRGQLATA